MSMSNVGENAIDQLRTDGWLPADEIAKEVEAAKVEAKQHSTKMPVAVTGTNWNGTIIEINVHRLIEQMNVEQKRQIAQTLTWDKEVLDELVCQLMEGFAAPSYNGNFFKARLAIIEKLEGAQRLVIRELMQDVAQAKAEEKRHDEWAWSMYRNWPDTNEFYVPRPDMPAWVSASYPSDEEVEAAIAEHAARQAQPETGAKCLADEIGDAIIETFTGDGEKSL